MTLQEHIETLKEHINDIRNGLRDGAFTNEESVKQGIVLRLLHALGWPRYNTQVIIPEYSVEGGRVDFALCHPALNPLVFIEAKQVGKIEGAEKQLFEYAYEELPIAILTDGQKWSFFYPSGQGDYGERLVYQLDLIETDLEESAERLHRYLNYKLIRNGKATEAIEYGYRFISQWRQIEEAWSKLLEKGSGLVRLVAEEVKIRYEDGVADEQVLDFLKSLEKATSPPPPPLTDRRRPTRLVVTFPCGKIIKHHSAMKTFAEVIEKLGGVGEVEKVSPGFISTSKSPTHKYKLGQYWVKYQTDTKTKKQMLKRIASRLGIQLKVEIVAKESN